MLRRYCIPKLLRANSVVRRCINNHVGLFGVEKLFSHSDFKPLTSKAMTTIDYIRDNLLCVDSLTPKETLLLLDSISNELCCVIDLAELCRNVHSNEKFQLGAEESFGSLSSFIHKLNTDKSVYAKLVGLVNNKTIWDSFSYEEKLFVNDLKNEFESDGIHLTGEAKHHALQLQGIVVANETNFAQNTVNDQKEIVVGPFPKQSNINVLKAWLESLVTQRQFTQSDRYLICSSDRRVCGSLLRSIEQERLRKQLFCTAVLQPSSNMEALVGLVQSRQALAKALGFESFAHKYLANKVLRSPAKVEAFLKSISFASNPQTQRELGILSDLKLSLPPEVECKESNTSEKSAESGFDSLMSKLNPFRNKTTTTDTAPTSSSVQQPASSNGELNSWDIPFLSSLYQSRALREDSVHTRAQAYFPLSACIDGLRLVSKQLFGITLQEETMGEYERWVPLSSEGKRQTGRSPATEEIKKFVVLDELGEVLGTVYLDLYMRPNKFPGAAHFTVKCGCSKFDTSRLDERVAESSAVPIEAVQQLPVVTLVLNFNPSRTAGKATESNGLQSLLSLSDVETLHHEWGHALHSLMSRTRFQHLSGTRGGADLIEVPSHLLEYFARSPEVISQWARHHITGEPVPPELLRDALTHKGEFGAIELQNQLLFSAADQFLFGPGIGDLSGLSAEQIFERIVTGLVEVQKEFTALPLTVLSVGEARRFSGEDESLLTAMLRGRDDHETLTLPAMNLFEHTHFVNYGGGYYSYLFAKMYAAQIWHKRFAADPLSRSAGDLLWKKMLIFGSGKDPNIMLSELADGELDPTHYLKTVLFSDDEEL